MNSRSSSISFPAPRLQQRPSFTARLSAATIEQGDTPAATGAAEHQIDEEIEEIKRYEVCTDDLSLVLLSDTY
jgi:chloride channel 3/4/5